MLIPAMKPAPEAYADLVESKLPGAPVVEADELFVGVVQRKTLESGDLLEGSQLAAFVDDEWPTVAQADHLDVVIDRLTSRGVNWACVLNDGRVVGIVGMSDLIGGYRGALRESLNRLVNVRPQTTLIEEAVGETSQLVGTTIAESGWPAGTVALSLARGAQLIFPSADTVLEAGDIITLVSGGKRTDEIREQILGRKPEAPGPPRSDESVPP
jgi:hypothetical protein